MAYERPKVVVSIVNLMRTEDLLQPFEFKDTEGLIDLLFHDEDPSVLLADPDIQRKISQRALVLSAFPNSAALHDEVSELMGLSIRPDPPGILLNIDDDEIEPGSYGLAWNFYLNEGGEKLTPLHQYAGQFCGNDLCVGFFLEYLNLEKQGLPLGLVPVAPMFSGVALRSAIGEGKFNANPVQALSDHFGQSTSVPFDPKEQAELFAKQQIDPFTRIISGILSLRNDRDKRIVAELHTAISDGFERLLPRLTPDTNLVYDVKGLS